MRISSILERKGSDVVTVGPDDPVRALLTRLAEHRVGALVVSADGVGVAGIVSERDVVRALADRGDGLLDAPVREIMTAQVRTCRPDASLDELAELMTEQRIRHVPVCQDDRLVGIVSIGDVVKQRLAELQTERDQLTAYITS